jgi:elongation factor 3
MFGPKSRKRQARLAAESVRSNMCVCGNFCGADGLCNACRATKTTDGLRQIRGVLPGGQPRKVAEVVRKAVLCKCPDSVEEEVKLYLCEMASELLEDAGSSLSFAVAHEEIENSFLPLLEGYAIPAKDASAFCQIVTESAFSSLDALADQKNHREQLRMDTVQRDEKLICRVPNFLLMYGGSPEPLLKNTTFEVVRGHRYGIVGTNGSGKTTLMARIANKDIAGLPESLKVAHLRHDNILEGVTPVMTAEEYVQQRSRAQSWSHLAGEHALTSVGFNSEFLGRAVVELSGGWQMRLALACAMAQEADVLLLDEPTNHLDAAGHEWLANFITKSGVGGEPRVTVIVVSHDAEFLDHVCTDIIHFAPEGKLAYYPGNFSLFSATVLGGDSTKAREILKTTSSSCLGLEPLVTDPVKLPSPGKVSADAMIMIQNVYYQYPKMDCPVLSNVNVTLRASNHVGIVGENGSGKSTLLALIAGRLQPTAQSGCLGKIHWQKGLRLAYVAQHSVVHLGEYQHVTPLEYLQLRFRRGFDFEAPKIHFATPSHEESERLRMLGARHGKCGQQVEELLSRIEYAEESETQCLYEVKWTQLGRGENTFETRGKLKQLGVEEMAIAFDQMLWSAWGGVEPRPLTTREIVQHFRNFGLSEDVTCNRKIQMLSSGQKFRLAFAAAFWARPHVLCLDEPTNYLDRETVEVLSHAIRTFRGCCVVVSHSKQFVEDVCNEVWELKHGRLAIQKSGPNVNSLLGRKCGSAKAKAQCRRVGK